MSLLSASFDCSKTFPSRSHRSRAELLPSHHHHQKSARAHRQQCPLKVRRQTLSFWMLGRRGGRVCCQQLGQRAKVYLLVLKYNTCGLGTCVFSLPCNSVLVQHQWILLPIISNGVGHVSGVQCWLEAGFAKAAFATFCSACFLERCLQPQWVGVLVSSSFAQIPLRLFWPGRMISWGVGRDVVAFGCDKSGQSPGGALY